MPPDRGPWPARTEITLAQSRLLGRYRNGLLRLADVFSARSGVSPAKMMFVIADQRSGVGAVIRELCPSIPKDVVVLPGLEGELIAWIERLALSRPVWDCSGSSEGTAVIVIDGDGHQALLRLRR